MHGVTMKFTDTSDLCHSYAEVANRTLPRNRTYPVYIVGIITFLETGGSQQRIVVLITSFTWLHQ